VYRARDRLRPQLGTVGLLITSLNKQPDKYCGTAIRCPLHLQTTLARMTDHRVQMWGLSPVEGVFRTSDDTRPCLPSILGPIPPFEPRRKTPSLVIYRQPATYLTIHRSCGLAFFGGDPSPFRGSTGKRSETSRTRPETPSKPPEYLPKFVGTAANRHTDLAVLAVPRSRDQKTGTARMFGAMQWREQLARETTAAVY